MFKKLMLTVLWLTFFVNYSFAATNFSVITESDAGDYIGAAKGRNFNPTNNDKLTIRNATTNTVEFSIESFNLGTPMTFSFAAATGTVFAKWLYTPAKRSPFRGSYNGIDVSWDGRGCNTILGKFYVHEYVVSPSGVVEKAAIDFVQYCEGGTAGLYWSLRYNSTVASSCTKAWSCTEAKKNLEVSNITSSNQTDLASMKLLQKLYKKKYRTFSSFMFGEYNLTYKKDFANISKYCKVATLFDTNTDSPNFFKNNTCGTKYNDIIEYFNEMWAEGASNEDSSLDEEAILTLRSTVLSIKQERASKKQPVKDDIWYSLAILSMIRFDYLIHQLVFAL